MKMTNKTNVFAPIALASRSLFGSEEVKSMETYSINELTEPQQKLVLGRQHVGTEDVGDTLCGMFSASFKAMVASFAEDNFIHKPLADKVWNLSDKVAIRATAEYYDKAKDEIIVIKPSKIYGYKNNVSGASNEFYNTAYLNALMARQFGFTPKTMRLIVLIQDHSKKDAVTQENYPESAITEMVWDVPEADETAEKALLDTVTAKLESVRACVEDGVAVAPCSTEELYSKVTYKLTKPEAPRAKASGDAEKITEAWKALKDSDKAVFRVVRHTTFPSHCYCYCPFADICPQHQAYLANGGSVADTVEDITEEFTANL